VWKNLASKYTAIRRASYLLARTVFAKLPELVTSQLKAVAPLTLAIVGEKEPSTHAAMWPALITFLQSLCHSMLLVLTCVYRESYRLG
jgi:hypothetical protein